MPTGSTQALAAMHRGGETTTEPHRLLLQRMEPLFRPAPTTTTTGRNRDDRRLTKLLVNVTVDRSLWPVHLVLDADATVADLVRAAVAAYVREGRRPPLQTGTPADATDGFELHLNKYSLESTCTNLLLHSAVCSLLFALLARTGNEAQHSPRAHAWRLSCLLASLIII